MESVLFALRNLGRQRVRTLITLAAISCGVIALLLAGGFIEWIFWAMRDAAINTGLGHIQVTRTGYRAAGGADPYSFVMSDSDAMMTEIEGDAEVKGVAPRLIFSGLISKGDTTLAFVCEGIDPRREASVSPILILVSGRQLTAADEKGFMLGRGLAANLGASPGDKVVLLVSTKSGINAVEAPVVGIFSNQVKTYDDVTARVPIGIARELLRVKGAHIVVVSLRDTDATDRIVAKERAHFPIAAFEFIPWYALSDFYGKAVALLSKQINLVALFIGIVIVLTISNGLIMSVLERTQEIGTMMALGNRRTHVLSVFLIEGALLGIIGGGLGTLLGLALAAIISAVGIPMPPPPGRDTGFSAQVLVTPTLACAGLALAVAASVLASLYPAWKASRLQIVDALRHNV